ncbi:alpha/beta hydrolase [Corynebacterium amycolatum]|uniref:alpha/beta hydrolase n=1 Tax=Corynebacterium amycolatum TaxID=43765 RepID=UPI00399A562D
MVTVGEALLWRVDSLETLARALRSGARALTDSADSSQAALNALSEDDFAGDNRSAAEVSVTHSSTRLRRSSVALERLAACCSDTAAMLNDVIRELTAAVNQATNLGFQVNLVSGAVTPPEGMLSAIARSLVHPKILSGPFTMAEWRATSQLRIQSALAELNRLDEKAAGAISALSPLVASGVSGSGRLQPSQAGSGTGNPADRGLDGGWDLEFGSGLTGAYSSRPLSEIDAAMSARARALGLPPGQLLESSPGHSAIAFGDVERASTVITLVPGTSSSAEDASRQFERVAATFHAAGEDPEDVAVVLFSYDAPPDLREAIRTEYHNFAAERLQHLQAGLIERSGGVDSGDTAIAGGLTSHGTSSTQRHVVAGYSYGATVVSQASLGSGLYADRVLLIAPPGVGPGLERANDMKLLKPDGTVRPENENSHRVAVATSPMDPIRIPAELGIHGKNPADKDFGAYALNLSERGLSMRDLAEFMVTPVQDIPQKYRHIQGNPHIEHYFDDEVFTREANRWLTDS